MTASVDWDLSPTDVPTVATLRYAPILFFGGVGGLIAIAGIVAAPALLRNPEILALVVLLALVGGPFSLLYLWPVIRDPDQRPDAAGLGWLQSLDPVRAGITAVAGTITILVGAATLGGMTVYVLLLLCLVVPLPLVSLFDGEGRVDREAGTLTFQGRTIDVETLAAVRRYRFETVTVCWLSYVTGEGGPGRPRVVAFPDPVADEVLATLEAGVAADADVRTEERETDRAAQAVLGGVAVLFFGIAGGAILVFGESGVPLASIGGLLGLVFVLGAYAVA